MLTVQHRQISTRQREKHGVWRIRPINCALEGRVTLSKGVAAYGKRVRNAEPLGQES